MLNSEVFQAWTSLVLLLNFTEKSLQVQFAVLFNIKAFFEENFKLKNQLIEIFYQEIIYNNVKASILNPYNIPFFTRKCYFYIAVYVHSNYQSRPQWKKTLFPFCRLQIL